MVSEEFVEKIVTLLKSRLGDVTVQLHNTIKNNGIRLTGLVIQEQNSNVAPCIYLEDFYSDYEERDKNIEDIAEEIISLYQKNRVTHDFNVSMLTDYSCVRPMLRGRLINTERNTERLKGIPHREFFDFSLIYCVEFPCPDNQGMGNVQVRDEQMELWGVTEQELYSQVMENMTASDRASIINMVDIFTNMQECLGEKEEEKAFPMYVLTNQCKCNGAVQILNKMALEEAAGLLGSDFFILPSSIHETILIPAEESDDTPEDLAKMVHEVNETVLSKDEFLSSHVYRYCTRTRQIQLAA